MECKDKNCPKHGNLKVRGLIIEGIIVSDKPENTVILEKERVKFIQKYMRYEKRKTKISAHKPPCMNVKVGDKVKVGECRKISKTKAFVVLEKIGEK